MMRRGADALQEQGTTAESGGEVSVDALSHEGRGVAHVAGKTLFLDGALPGERVAFRRYRRRRRFDEGRVTGVAVSSPDRVEPHCAHFDDCGGCSLQHLSSEAQTRFKENVLLDQLKHIGKVKPGQVLTPITADPWGYRRQARLGVRYVEKKGRVLVGFREKGSSYLAELSRCEVLHPSVGRALPDLAALVGELSVYRRLAQIEVAIGDSEVALVFRNLDPLTTADREKMVDFGERRGWRIYEQPGGAESVRAVYSTDRPLSYRLPGHDLELLFEPGDFTQVNAAVNRQMVDRALDLLELSGSERVLDLFCGMGNFTLPMARAAALVVGVEGSSAMVGRARANADRNGIANVEVHAANLADDVRHLPWAAEPYDRILLDPPRTGAAAIMPLIAGLGAGRIVYVSCQPATLARDAGVLVHGHGYRLAAAGVMDMFPHTGHVESIALFEAGKA